MDVRGDQAMVIRAATPDDHQAILDIYNRIHYDGLPVGLEEYRAYLSDAERGVRIETWVAEENGEIAGSLDISEQRRAREPGVFMMYLVVRS
jgi:L-amino acid N-acyltransferase YncA